MARDNSEWLEGFRLRTEDKPRPPAGRAERRLGWDAADAMYARGGYGG